MNGRVALQQLTEALSRIMPAIPPKSTLFVLEHVLIEAADSTIKLTGTDTELTITASVPASVDEAGSVLVPARKLYDVAKALPDDVEAQLLYPDDGKFVLQTGIGRYEFPTLAVEEYPELPTIEHHAATTLSADDAKLLAETTVYAASTDEYRPAMTGVKLELAGSELTAVATDGYRLATVTLQLSDPVAESRDAIIPAQAFSLLAKLSEAVTVGLGTTHASLVTPTTTITTRLIDQSYPAWRNVIPSESSLYAIIDRAQLLKAIRRVALFTTATNHLVRFRFDGGSLELTVRDPDSGAKATETLACSFDGDQFEIGFNHKYIAEALAHVPTEYVRLSFSSPSKAVLITPVGELPYSLTKLVMPMRLG